MGALDFNQVNTPAPPPTTRPAVVTWFIVYCVAMALLYLAVAVVGVIILSVPPADLDMEPDAKQWFGC